MDSVVAFFSANPLWIWVTFLVFIAALLALDLGVFHRANTEVSAKEALGWSAFWIALALLFGLGIGWFQGAERMQEYMAGFLIEKSLAVDNIFVFIMLFSFFGIRPHLQHRVLFLGIVGAIIFRAIFILAGAALLARFHWLIYVFGLFLVGTGIKMWLMAGKEPDPEQNPVIRFLKRFMPMTHDAPEDAFWVRRAGKLLFTPLFVCLVAIEISDIVFAVDSIPAIFAVTNDPFIVFTSNIFAILGLRSLYFLAQAVLARFYLLNYGVAVILAFVGVKMLLIDVAKIPISLSLGVIAAILCGSVALSVLRPQREKGVS